MKASFVWIYTYFLTGCRGVEDLVYGLCMPPTCFYAVKSEFYSRAEGGCHIKLRRPINDILTGLEQLTML